MDTEERIAKIELFEDGSVPSLRIHVLSPVLVESPVRKEMVNHISWSKAI